MSKPSSTLAIIAALLGLLLWSEFNVVDSLDTQGADLSALVFAGYFVDTGQPQHLYDAGRGPAFNVVDTVETRIAAHDLGYLSLPTRFVHPPLVAWLMAPASKITFDGVMFLWTMLSAIAVLVALKLVLVLYAPSLDSPLHWAVLLVVLCLFIPLKNSFSLGQTTPFIFFLVVLALYLQRRGHPIAAGLVLSVTIFLKITPALLSLIWLWRGPRKGFVAALLGTVALFAISTAVAGVDLTRQYVDTVRDLNQHVLVSFNNHSFVAYWERFKYPLAEAFTWRLLPLPAATRAVSALLALAVIGGAAWLASRVRDEQLWRPHLEAVALLAGLLFSPISWTHYFVFILPVLAILWTTARAGDRRVTAFVIALAFLACCRGVLPSHEPRMTMVSANAIVPAPTYGAFLLLGAVLVALRRGRKDAGEAT